MAIFHLLRVLRPTYRQIYLSRTLPLYAGVLHRHFFSDTVIRSSQEATLTIKPRKPRTLKPKPTQSPQLTDKDEAATLLVKPRKPRTPKPKSTGGPQLTGEDEAAILPVKRHNRRGRGPRKSELTEEDEAALRVSKLNLPPIDKWRQYFAIMEAQRLRFFLRNPDTARILAEAFVPEGSEDLIVIEAAAGMHSYLFIFVRSW